MITQYAKRAVDHYIDHGIPPASFLHAVLINDLFDAASRADQYNRPTLADICDYIVHCAPHTCYGSAEKVKAWLKFHRGQPKEANEAASADREKRAKYYELQS